MTQQVMTSPGEITFQQIPVPVPGPGEVLLKVMKIGVCGSDIHVWHGKHPFTSYPVTQGHEVSCCVDTLGEGVDDLHVGDKVTIQPQMVCGKCYACTHGKYNLCESLKVMGFQTTGVASTYFCTDRNRVTRLPEDMSYDQGAMIEPLSVAIHAAKRFPQLQGARVAVIGAGPIGILVAQSVKALSAEKVMVTDISDFRLAKAKECGVDYVYNTRHNDFGQCLEASFGSDKADVIYDCAGNDITMAQAIKYARKGSTIILVAVYSGMASVDLAVLNDHELDLNTTMMYRSDDYDDAIQLASEGRIVLEPLISKTFAFCEYADAYRYIEANRETSMKILIDVQA